MIEDGDENKEGAGDADCSDTFCSAENFTRRLLEMCGRGCSEDLAAVLATLKEQKAGKDENGSPEMPVKSEGDKEREEDLIQELMNFYDDTLEELKQKVILRPQGIRKMLLLDLLSFQANEVGWAKYSNNDAIALKSDEPHRVLATIIPADSKVGRMFLGGGVVNYSMTSAGTVSILIKKEKVDKVWAAIGYLDSLTVAQAHENGLPANKRNLWGKASIIDFVAQNVLTLLEVFDTFSNDKFSELLVAVVERCGMHTARDVLRFWRDEDGRAALIEALDGTLGFAGEGISAHKFGRDTQYLYSLAQVALFVKATKEGEPLSIEEGRHQMEIIIDFEGRKNKSRK